jgi:hypothetical protein
MVGVLRQARRCVSCACQQLQVQLEALSVEEVYLLCDL